MSPPINRRLLFPSLIVVLSAALASWLFYSRYREATLKLDLYTIRDAIDHYTLDKQQSPQSLEELVKGRYLVEIPTDPFTHKKDWVPYFSDTVMTPDQTATGIADVHSNSTQVGSNGSAYNTW